MLNESIKIGILFSLTGTTAVTEIGQYQATLLAIKQINEEGGINGFPIIPFVEDIASDTFLAQEKARKLIKEDKVHILMGTYTSACRKSVIPILEQENILLIYPTLYEGNEQNKWVFYSGTLPNQQLQFFIPWITANLGKSIYLVSSDYIFPRETNYYIRRLLKDCGGKVVGESYHSLGTKNFEPVLKDIDYLQPDVIFSTLVGESAVSFYQQMHKYGMDIPICSSITAETEIHAMGGQVGTKIYSSFPYFKTISSEANQIFVQSFQKEYGSNVISSVMENSYNSIFLLRDSLLRINHIDTASLRKSLSLAAYEAPQGKIWFDECIQHLWQYFRIGLVNTQGTFDIIWESEKPIAPSPFLKGSLLESEPRMRNRNNEPEVLPEEELKVRRARWEDYFSLINKAASLYPFHFFLIDSAGYLIESFQSVSPLINQTGKPGTQWTIQAKGKNGFGLALMDKQTNLCEGNEHEDILLEKYITAGIPIINEGDCLGVIGIIANNEDGIQLIPKLRAVELFVEALGELISEGKKRRIFQEVIQQSANEKTEGFMVFGKNELLITNQQVAEMADHHPYFIQAMTDILEESTAQPADKYLRKRLGSDAFEIHVKSLNDYQLINIKSLNDNNEYHVKNKDITFQDIIGMDNSFLNSVSIAKTASHTEANVLIIGESGTGKELFANAIHNESNRSSKPFLAINCGAIPKELIYSELFGYVDGAFTGAKKGGKPGLFEAANGGTVFLDEIGEMPIDLQVSLLRIIQEREVTRIGDHTCIPVDVRIIAATNKNIADEIAYNGSFRSDLYYRLNVFQIDLPSLRERREDIPELANYFLKRLNQKNHTNKSFSLQSVEALSNYHWPGNIRELSNVAERSFYISGAGKEIEIGHLNPYIVRKINDAGPEKDEAVTIIDSAATEKELILAHLAEIGPNISKVARKLGVSRTTLYKKLNFYQIKIER